MWVYLVTKSYLQNCENCFNNDQLFMGYMLRLHQKKNTDIALWSNIFLILFFLQMHFLCMITFIFSCMNKLQIIHLLIIYKHTRNIQLFLNLDESYPQDKKPTKLAKQVIITIFGLLIIVHQVKKKCQKWLKSQPGYNSHLFFSTVDAIQFPASWDQGPVWFPRTYSKSMSHQMFEY